jgi:hypothetical protein
MPEASDYRAIEHLGDGRVSDRLKALERRTAGFARDFFKNLLAL